MKRQLLVACTLSLLVCAAVPAFAINGSIIISENPDGSSCQTDLQCAQQKTIYVFALLQGASGSGITGVEYGSAHGPYATPDEGAGEDLNPDGLTLTEDFTPATNGGATVLGSGGFSPGDPGDRGVNVAWPSCQTGDGTKVLIQTVVIGTFDCALPETRLRIIKHDSESNQFFQCPLFTLCDAPSFTKVCVGNDPRPCTNPVPPFAKDATCSSSGEFVVNGTGDCVIAVEKTTWSHVKGMYQN